jgi:DNA end-binding protein Ku
LAEVMQQSGRAGIATFVMRDREYLVAILAENGILRAETLRFEDELRSPETVGLPTPEETNRSDVSRVKQM